MRWKNLLNHCCKLYGRFFLSDDTMNEIKVILYDTWREISHESCVNVETEVHHTALVSCLLII